jgi:hypothetical protein
VKALSARECVDWCLSRKVETLGAYQKPGFGGGKPHSFSIALPETARGRASLSVALFHDDQDHPIAFNGGLCWLHRWNIGSQDIEDIGMAIARSVRAGFSATVDMQDAPGFVFERSELMELRSLFVLNLLFEWDASFVDSRGEFIVSMSHDGVLYFVSRSQAEKDRLVRRYAESWDVIDRAAPRYLTDN